MSSKDHPRRRSKATAEISGGVLASIQGGRAQISTKTPGVNYEGTACSAMDAGEIGIGMPELSKMPNAVPTSRLVWPVSNHTRRLSLWYSSDGKYSSKAHSRRDRATTTKVLVTSFSLGVITYRPKVTS